MSRRHRTSPALVATILASAISCVNGLSSSTPHANAASTPTYYVAGDGNDSANGSSSAPFATPARALIAAGAGPAIVRVGPGEYPSFRDQIVRRSTVLVDGIGSPQLDGVDLMNDSNLTFRGVAIDHLTTRGATNIGLASVKFSGPVTIGSSTAGAGVDSRNISLTDSDLTSPDSACLTIRPESTNVTVARNYIHNCRVGIAGPGDTDPSQNLLISTNYITNMSSDGIQFGAWKNAMITGNVIDHVADPAGIIHNDGIQMTGGASSVTIARNVLAHSDGQLLLIQGSRGPIDGVQIESNLIHDSAAIAVQISKASDVQFINNTVWDSGIGGFLVRAPSDAPQTDTVVANNILNVYAEMDGAHPDQVAGNIIGKCATRRTGNLCGAVPQFNDAADGDYTLPNSSPYRAMAVGSYEVSLDLFGNSFQAATPGAIK